MYIQKKTPGAGGVSKPQGLKMQRVILLATTSMVLTFVGYWQSILVTAYSSSESRKERAKLAGVSHDETDVARQYRGCGHQSFGETEGVDLPCLGWFDFEHYPAA